MTMSASVGEESRWQQVGFGVLFGETFLEEHAGTLMTNPQAAIVELVANSWDAGADVVDITWPEVTG